MEFKELHMSEEFEHGLHPTLKQTVIEFDDWLFANKMPQVCLTEVLRSDAQQEIIYFTYAQKLINALRRGDKQTQKDRDLAAMLSSMTVPDLRRWARTKFSWHKVACAVDIRSKSYTQSQLAAISTYLNQGRKRSEWEILIHDVTAPHIHIGFKDQKWKDTYPQHTTQGAANA